MYGLPVVHFTGSMYTAGFALVVFAQACTIGALPAYEQKQNVLCAGRLEGNGY